MYVYLFNPHPIRSLMDVEWRVRVLMDLQQVVGTIQIEIPSC